LTASPRWLGGLLLANAAVCLGMLGNALLPGGCGACGRTGTVLPAAGLVVYLVLAWASRRPLPGRPASYLLAAAAGVHLGLVASMVVTSSFCWMCAAAAVLCWICLVGWMLRGRGPVWEMGAGVAMAGAAAFLAAVPLVWLSQEPDPGPGKTRLLVFERSGCSACESFRRSVKPRLLQIVPELDLEFRPAEGAVWLVPSTPMLVLLRPGGRKVVLDQPLDPGEIARQIRQHSGTN